MYLAHSLQGVSGLVQLMELYSGNNEIGSALEVELLRPLSQLIILDTSGNPMCSSPHFRLFVVYKLSKLKVLDGVAVQWQEHTEARSKYSGKVSHINKIFM
ncbi:unnamed protein product [Choristocarpus tenellus]